jgi:hypothetical protein
MSRYWYRAVRNNANGKTRTIAARGGGPIQEEANSEDVERSCQAVSPDDEPCDYPATVHCPTCGRWFCDAHAEDEEWHACMVPLGDEGGKA